MYIISNTLSPNGLCFNVMLCNKKTTKNNNNNKEQKQRTKYESENQEKTKRSTHNYTVTKHIHSEIRCFVILFTE
jgi:hypothetical protein